jgi:hypothetical protein
MNLMDSMLRKRQNKNTLVLNQSNDPISQRLSYVKEILKDSTFFPKTVKFRDIDEEFVKWVEDELKIVYEEQTLPTYALFSNQRYSEYMQMWETMDDNNNLKLNFKVITRENNPKDGTMYGGLGTVPVSTKYLMNRIEALNDDGSPCYIEHRMKQPVTVDLSYKLTLITNKYELLNEFNMMMHEKFSELHCYIFPNGHSMPMKLKNISDESEYTVDDRQYFAQTYDILLMGYIIDEDSFDIEVKPIVTLRCIGGDVQRRNAQVEIEEFEILDTCADSEERYYNQPMKVTISYDKCDKSTCEFTMDCKMIFTKITGENIKSYVIKSNDNVLVLDENGFLVNDGDVISLKIVRIRPNELSTIIIDGYSPDVIYNKKEDEMESVLDNKNYSLDIEIE